MPQTLSISTKTNPTLIKRFTGRTGKARFIEALQPQELVARDIQIARALAAAAKRRELPPDHEILTQGGFDSDIYFILSSSVSIIANGRQVATRTAGDHAGEMAMLDTTATRAHGNSPDCTCLCSLHC